MSERNNWMEVIAKLKEKNSDDAMEYYIISWDVIERHIDKVQHYKRIANYQREGSARAMIGAKALPKEYTEDNSLYMTVVGEAEELHKSLLKRIIAV